MKVTTDVAGRRRRRGRRWSRCCWPIIRRPARASRTPATASSRRWRRRLGVGAAALRAPACRRAGATTRRCSIAVDHEACILCDRCIRGCDEVKQNIVIGRSGKGYTTRHRASTSTCPMGSLDLRVVRRVHGLVPDRRADQQARRSTPSCRRRRRCSTPSELLQLPVFAGVSGTFLELNQGAVVRRHVPGRARSSAARASSARPRSTSSSGTVEVYIATPIGHTRPAGRTPPGGMGFFRMPHRAGAEPRRAHPRPRTAPALHPDRRTVDLALRQADRPARRRAISSAR